MMSKMGFGVCNAICAVAVIAALSLCAECASARNSEKPAHQPLRTTRLCVTEWPGYYSDSEDAFRSRFVRYRELGVETIRIQTGALDNPALVRTLRAFPFRIKYILYVLGIPKPYTARYPGQTMVDEHGAPDWHLGPWSPAFAETTWQAAIAQLHALRQAGLADRVDEVVVDLGPAGEGIYPANWTLGRTGEEAYWFYSSAAQADFRRAMRAKYVSITAARTAWGVAAGQRFSDWSDVAIPKPGTDWARGAFWNDVLVWYRDAKRHMILARIDQTQALVKRYLLPASRCIVYLPGTAYTRADWNQAVATASGPASIRLMMDNDWLMFAAAKRGCVLQYTGAENVSEVRSIVQKLKAGGIRAYASMWAENAGVEGAGRNPEWLADEVVAYGLRGVDFTWSNWLFERDGVTPSATYSAFARASRMIHASRQKGYTHVAAPAPDLAREVSPGEWRLQAVVDTRIMDHFPDDIHGADPEIAAVSGSQIQNLLLRFPLELLPKGKPIAKARLILKRDGANDGGGAPCKLNVYRITQFWHESAATWDNSSVDTRWVQPGGAAVGIDDQAGVSGQPFASAEVPSSAALGDAVEWDVTALVRRLAAGTNHGMMVVVGGKDGAQRSFASREYPDVTLRPTLVVDVEP